MTTKRLDYINWDEFFMGTAILAGLRSKDPSTQVGACIVDTDNTITGTGYNGFPRGCSDDILPWGKEGSFLDTKHPYVCHAELNAVLNSNSHNLKGCRIYVSLFPCNECVKVLIQAGISEVIYISDKHKRRDYVKASKRMLNLAGVKFRKFETTRKNIKISFGGPKCQKMKNGVTLTK